MPPALPALPALLPSPELVGVHDVKQLLLPRGDPGLEVLGVKFRRHGAPSLHALHVRQVAALQQTKHSTVSRSRQGKAARHVRRKDEYRACRSCWQHWGKCPDSHPIGNTVRTYALVEVFTKIHQRKHS